MAENQCIGEGQGVANSKRGAINDEIKVEPVKQVKFSPIPSIQCFDTDNVGRKHQEPVNQCLVKRNVNDVFTMFYSNVLSLSEHALDYVSALPKEVQALLLVGAHRRKFRI